MFPTLLHFGPLILHTYGVMLAIGLLVAVREIKVLSAKADLDPAKMERLATFCLLAGLVGARVLFVITQPARYIKNPLNFFKLWEGGLVFYGGLIFGAGYLIWYVRRHQLPLWRTFDVLVIGVAINHAFGRLGCFASGCCYGKPTNLPWGVRFNSGLVDENLRGIPLHPTQLYEATCLFLLFLLLRRQFKSRAFDGQVFLIYCLIYPIIRSVIEIFRGDLIRGFVIKEVVSTSQFISLIVFGVALFFYVKRRRAVLPFADDVATPPRGNGRRKSRTAA